ncbi:ribosome-binding factor A [Bifidobacterium pseudolongum subsp. globosum]|uniref:Ribosome-binding factor A n=1 Tax=Bifidobacterium pseudolongum subsp. globosum TaxID=1690 RepID=A0A2N3QUA5_9BIFI|nr:30S ribosome-binding factor RbfA [Bifidobacterium pseudolongum]MCH4834759.1 30S ribosome-binding factor RbfA [Bifidobacterium pseudolongum]MCH4849358.1 30S ribosome-binding factor RbfA [Bifidobacterium pseudolongum]MCH4851001.1 30S ribosome-binding factor RbfA [Bifidobacterium pseudolongum]MCH4856091.1 30S ribosome-binding factor RbfA [Bifidobacterium pseudolongum]MCH4859710.1 30S ribosome-binding factor RbfA [Bifidobacterium pseudolongum]
MQGTNPRAARIAALIQRVIASNMESTLHDKRLKNVTITDVKVTNDLQLAKVYWTTISHTGNDEGERKRAQTALNQARGRLRTMVGAKAGLRLTPQLQFIFDEVPGEAHEIDDIIVAARRRDEELARMRANAQYAGEADPYKHDDEDETEDKIERLKHEDKDEYNEYDGDVVTVEELEDFDDDEDAVDGSDDDPVDPAELDPQSTIDGAQD